MWHILYNGMLLSNKRKRTLMYITTWISLKGIVLSEIRQSQKYTLYVSIYMILSKNRELECQRTDQGLAWVRGKRRL